MPARLDSARNQPRSVAKFTSPLSESDRARIRLLRLSGLSTREVAARTGVSRTTVSRLAPTHRPEEA
jgi:DNA-directed RNA polymerase specialized sigma24 family protein